MRVCAQCDSEFEPSSKHKRCPKCRRQNKNKAGGRCACGAIKQAESKTCRACSNLNNTGTNNRNWKGGKTRHKAGYTMVYLPSHPRARTSGYVFEHILVMEQMLKRPLHPGETPHHKNGVRDDNRPDNLELWTRPQPSGIRASDAVDWAVEVLSRYAAEKLA